MKNKKRFLMLMTALLLSTRFGLTAPAQAVSPGAEIAVSKEYDWTRFSADNITLNVYNWGQYISDGSDGSVDILAAFEDLTGIRVNYTTFDSNESLYAKLKSGGAAYDVIIPSDYMVGRMIEEEMLAELDLQNIPNFSQIGEEYLGWDFDPENRYSVPYTWGTTGLVYNTTMVEQAPTSWTALWDIEYANNVLMFNNSRDAYAIAAAILGYPLNPQSVEQVDTVMAKLTEQKPIVQAYVMDEIFDKMAGGEAALAPYYAGDALTMIDDNPDLAFVHPVEGVNFFVDSMCIPIDAPHKEAAELFINYMCEPEVAFYNIDYIGYSTPIPAVREMLDDDVKNSPFAYPAAEVMEKAQVFVTLPPEINAAMDAKWSEMKSYDENGSGWLVIVFLVLALAISAFNIWRKLRKKMRDSY